MADSDETALLRRRARRRLVGAIALVVLAVIVLPIVFDKEPRPISQDIVIQIPSQNSGRFNSKVLPPPATDVKAQDAMQSEPSVKTQTAAMSEAPKSAETRAAASAKEPAKSAETLSNADAEAARAQAALQGEAFVIHLGAYLNQANVKSLQTKVTQAGFKSYSEIQKVAKGEQIRVRAGPFPSREEAERAREQLQSTGLTVGPVTKL
ncbi:MAG: hypothetical protein EXR28_17025 [Betaproteobacteria bacterium]|nr:hypothetical protein [Betaproteobacteria bacterium]